MGMFNDSTFQIRVVNDSTSGIALTSANGYVGIGTTTPAYKLDVAGTVRATGGYAILGWKAEGERVTHHRRS